jgi:ParB-like chromosome segregation protein Spo0J
MADLKQLAESRRPAYNFSVDVLQVKEGFNARGFDDPENQAHVDQLTQSMIDNGFDTDKPIAIFTEDDVVYVADGGCRLRAAKAAGITIVPCIPVPAGLKEADLILRQNRANSAKPFTTLEQARNFARAAELGKTVDEIAKASSCSASHVRNWLRLDALEPEIKDLVAEGKVAAKVAIESEPEALKEAVEAADGERVTPRNIAPREPKPSVKAFIKKMAKRKDPLEADDFDQEIRDFADLINEAKALKKEL